MTRNRKPRRRPPETGEGLHDAIREAARQLADAGLLPPAGTIEDERKAAQEREARERRIEEQMEVVRRAKAELRKDNLHTRWEDRPKEWARWLAEAAKIQAESKVAGEPPLSDHALARLVANRLGLPERTFEAIRTKIGKERRRRTKEGAG